jgi:hypothetical protein
MGAKRVCLKIFDFHCVSQGYETRHFISLGVQGDSEISIFQFLSCWRVSCNHIFYSIETFSVALYCMKLETSAQLSPGHQISVSHIVFSIWKLNVGL